MAARSWSGEDDLVAMYISNFGTTKLPCTVEEAADRIGKTLASLLMRVKNFDSHYGRPGLCNYGIRPEQLDEHYGHLDEPELRRLVLRHLGLAELVP